MSLQSLARQCPEPETVVPADHCAAVAALCLVLTRDPEPWSGRVVHADGRSLLMVGAANLVEARALLDVVQFQVALLLDERSKLEQQLLLTLFGTGHHQAGITIVPDHARRSCMIYQADSCIRLLGPGGADCFQAFLVDIASMLALGGSVVGQRQTSAGARRVADCPIVELPEGLADSLHAAIQSNMQRPRPALDAASEGGSGALLRTVLGRTDVGNLQTSGVSLPRGWLTGLAASGKDAPGSCTRMLVQLMAQAQALAEAGALAWVGVPLELDWSARESWLDVLVQVMSSYSLRRQQFVLEIAAADLEQLSGNELGRLTALHDSGFRLALTDYDGRAQCRQVLPALPFSLVKLSAAAWPEPWTLERSESWLSLAELMRVLVRDCREAGLQCVLEDWQPSEVELLARMAGFDWLQE